MSWVGWWSSVTHPSTDREQRNCTSMIEKGTVGSTRPNGFGSFLRSNLDVLFLLGFIECKNVVLF